MPALPPPTPPPSAVALTMIVRNESANLPGCLSSCAGLFDELVIVDTGSTDNTKEIARSFCDRTGRPARVLDFPWCDDFSAARNESLRHATSDWVMWMDADERIDRENLDAVYRFIESLPSPAVSPAVYWMNVLSSFPDRPAGIVYDRYPRLFPRTRVRWIKRVCETVCILGTAAEIPAVDTPIVIRHTGYSDPAVLARKNARNLRLLEMENRERPGDPNTMYHLGRLCLMADGDGEGGKGDRKDEGLSWLQKAAEGFDAAGVDPPADLHRIICAASR